MTISYDPTLICPVLIGRAATVQALRDQIEHVRAGSGRVALITGEAGIGKSRLTNELRAVVRGAEPDTTLRVAQGNCFEPDRSLPYAPLLDLFRTLVNRSAPDEIAHLFGPTASDLVKLLPALGRLIPDLTPAPDLDPEQEKRRLFQALSAFFTRLSAAGPLLLIIEDVHWSDDASLEFLLYFTRQIANEPILLLLTYRNDEIHPALADFLAMLDRERLATEFVLDRLSTPEVDAMLRVIFREHGTIRRDFVETVSTLTEGNPFFIEEIVKSLAAPEEHVASEGIGGTAQSVSALQIPRCVQVAVRRRSERLSPTARDVLLLAAVAGRRFDFALLQELTGQDETELLRTIKALIAAQLVVEESADRFAFRHALTRQAIYGELLARERRSLHRTIAETMERLYAPMLDAYLADLAYHFYEAAVWERALEYSRRVGERAQEIYAPHAAVEHFSRALGAAWQLDHSPPASLYRARGQAYETLGEFERARTDHETALEIARTNGDSQAEWQSLMDLGYLWAGRDYQRTGTFFRRAADLARTFDDPLVYARSLNRLANWLVNTGQTAEGLPIHYEALAVFEREGETHGTAETLDLLGMANGLAGDIVHAVQHYDDAIKLFRAVGDAQVLSSSLASRAVYQGPGMVETSFRPSGTLDECARDAAEALALARKVGWLAGEAFAEFAATSFFGTYGTFGAALAHGHETLRIATEIEHQQWEISGHWALGQTYVWMTLADPAIEHLERALPLARGLGSAWWTGNVTSYLALAYLLRHEPQRAEAVLTMAMPRDHAPQNAMERRMAWAWGETFLTLNQPDDALRVTDMLIDSAPGAPHPQPIPTLEKLRGDAFLALGQMDDAAQALIAAKQGAIESGARPLLWQIHRSLGTLYHRQKDDERERTEFAAARTVIASLTATIDDPALREQFNHTVLKTLPKERTRTPRQLEAEQYSGLTARERDVAGEIAHGKSNRAIADALFLSERTVATHISNILAKLELTSRAQIATWAITHRLTQSE